MDDNTITDVSHVQARWVLETLDIATWARITFKEIQEYSGKKLPASSVSEFRVRSF